MTAQVSQEKYNYLKIIFSYQTLYGRVDNRSDNGKRFLLSTGSAGIALLTALSFPGLKPEAGQLAYYYSLLMLMQISFAIHKTLNKSNPA
ncbi:hypothetical protein A2767_02040 [Candidatus Roizmanbacteria bacterium RIFCSPHIGHO2_01_FULL_35_10]|uniref:Uncharacterized protein n=1 Tax=Candidatus Roizmanbacteria bacterium RIFCSPLOWO2_01_FULL_35_13 TaxID=1802055 RepID=A0A1F7I7A3_9BACT|nr:MAG: hypothetical protein A2767_02040 [Candidatus Roizmanbacteria bacterium RIFCSPHIGHO2_01_FULL_35_10]OGK39241.1 MAG: hypothetical protein A3A74_07455 [Candidatus Roizmanbacteria bacterium RIFCSPLOWO2_01_FULL_35_13]